jgi:predicted secreted hydrolase
MDLSFTQTQSPLLQGENGLSRKGPREESASYYYSFPHLRVLGTLSEKDTRTSVAGTAWFDHEWSSSYMDERASGWDWIGINLDDGGALMAFRMRDADGKTFWASATYRGPDGTRHTFSQREVEFVPLRTWRSPRSGALYPVACRIDIPGISLTLEPLMDDQEQDTRLSVGTVYWEGAVIASRDGKPAGRGYLELTGYWRQLRGLTEEKAGGRTIPRSGSK